MCFCIISDDSFMEETRESDLILRKFYFSSIVLFYPSILSSKFKRALGIPALPPSNATPR
jgi:hypothetical protein